MAAVVDGREWARGHRGRSAKWDYRERVAATDAERALFERARNAATEAEGEGDAQFRAAVAAAAQAAAQVDGPPTRLSSCSLRFHCDQLEAAYRRKAATNSDSFDHVPVFLKAALSGPSLLVLAWLSAPLASLLPFQVNWQPELTFHELLSIFVGLACIVTLGIQLAWPRWYKSHRGTMLQYLVMFLWVWESAKLLVSTNDTSNVFVEVFFLNTFMSVLHRVPFSSHCQLRSYGGMIQAAAIICKAAAVRTRLQIAGLALAGHAVGLALAYALDRRSRKQFLRSLPSWLLDDLAGGCNGAGRYLSYRASLSRQMWSIFYPELLRCPQPSDAPIAAAAAAAGGARRALGGFAGGFGGVSGLNSARPCSNVSPPSSSSSLSGGESAGSSSDEWGGAGQTSSGVSCGEMVVETPRDADAADADACTSAAAACVWAATGSACSQSGVEPAPYHVRGRAAARGSQEAGRW